MSTFPQEKHRTGIIILICVQQSRLDLSEVQKLRMVYSFGFEDEPCRVRAFEE